jgi:hypothetical protein
MLRLVVQVTATPLLTVGWLVCWPLWTAAILARRY